MRCIAFALGLAAASHSPLAHGDSRGSLVEKCGSKFEVESGLLGFGVHDRGRLAIEDCIRRIVSYLGRQAINIRYLRAFTARNAGEKKEGEVKYGARGAAVTIPTKVRSGDIVVIEVSGYFFGNAFLYADTESSRVLPIGLASFGRREGLSSNIDSVRRNYNLPINAVYLRDFEGRYNRVKIYFVVRKFDDDKDTEIIFRLKYLRIASDLILRYITITNRVVGNCKFVPNDRNVNVCNRYYESN